jgi:hypothetical protein
MMMLLMLFVIIAIPVENHNPAMISISIPISVPVVLSLAHADRYMAFFRHNDGLFCRRGPRDYRGAQKCKRANDETKPLHVMFPLLGHLKTGIALGGGVTMNARIDVLFPHRFIRSITSKWHSGSLCGFSGACPLGVDPTNSVLTISPGALIERIYLWTFCGIKNGTCSLVGAFLGDGKKGEQQWIGIAWKVIGSRLRARPGKSGVS